MMNILLRVTAIKAKVHTPMEQAPARPAPQRVPWPQNTASTPTVFLPEGTPIEGTRRGVTIDFVKKTVCAAYNIGITDIESDTHRREFVLPRQVAMYLCHMLIEDKIRRSFPRIGQRFGGRDHATVAGSVRKIATRLKTDTALAEKVNELTAIIQTEAAKPILKIDVNAPGRI
ncbi:MAG: hypothetical protein DI585_00390 [Pseudomonas fluorescens]|nr:MAG: hypothetical protein DI585_00390 [Pseudomonas fluorescens]